MELDCALEFHPDSSEDLFRILPASPAVFCIEPRSELIGAAPYVLRTADLRRRIARLLGPPDPATKRLNLREFAGRVRWRVTGSKFEQSLVLWQHMRALDPQKYRARMRLRPAALLKVSLRNEYPRCYVTRRVLADGGFYFGPFPGRKAADAFAERFLDLFKMRHCQIKILRDPAFPGCIYSEMKMCLAPCFAGCSKEEYDAETARVVSFLATSGASLTEELEHERESASESTDFERAAAVHRRIEKVSEVLRGFPEPARRLEELDAVILDRAAEPNAIAAFLVRSGIVAEPFLLRFDELARPGDSAAQPRSLDAVLKERLEPRINADDHGLRKSRQPADRTLVEDHVALLARWYYSKPRSGEIFFPAPDWPYRRIVRACSRLLAGKKSGEPETQQ